MKVGVIFGSSEGANREWRMGRAGRARDGPPPHPVFGHLLPQGEKGLTRAPPLFAIRAYVSVFTSSSRERRYRSNARSRPGLAPENSSTPDALSFRSACGSTPLSRNICQRER